MTAPLLLSRLPLRGGAAFAAVLALWAGLSVSGAVAPLFLPSPPAVAEAWWRLVAEGSLWRDAAASALRIAAGFGVSALIALPLGVLCGRSEAGRQAVEPLTAFVRYIPPSAFVPLSILWLGIGEAQKWFVIVAAVAPYLLLLVADAVGNVRRELVDAAVLLGATPSQAVSRVVLPCAMPAIWDAVRIMLGAAWTFIILAEIAAAESGLGHALIVAQRFLQTPAMIAVMLTIGLLGLGADVLLQRGYRIFFPWAERARR